MFFELTKLAKLRTNTNRNYYLILLKLTHYKHLKLERTLNYKTFYF